MISPVDSFIDDSHSGTELEQVDLLGSAIKGRFRRQILSADDKVRGKR